MKARYITEGVSIPTFAAATLRKMMPCGYREKKEVSNIPQFRPVAKQVTEDGEASSGTRYAEIPSANTNFNFWGRKFF